MDIIVTDLTRFAKEDDVCIAGIDVKSMSCIRPLPYIKKAACRALKILPGAILAGDFTRPGTVERPHTEDMNHGRLTFKGPCTSHDFESVLKATLQPSINEGFDGKVPAGAKVIPYNTPPSKSIVTLKLKPTQIEIVRNAFDEKNLRLNILDNDERKYSYLSITDLGFHGAYISKKINPEEINEYVRGQKKLYLRVGLSRRYAATDGRDGFWLQINGIYTFPKFMTKVRMY